MECSSSEHCREQFPTPFFIVHRKWSQSCPSHSAASVPPTRDGWPASDRGPGADAHLVAPCCVAEKPAPPRARCVLAEHVGGEGASCRRFLRACSELHIKRTGPGTQGGRGGPPSVPVPGTLAVSLHVRKTVPKGPRPS